MVGKRKKKSLYEVIGKTESRSDYGETSEPLYPEGAVKDKSIAEDSDALVSERATKWPRKPKVIQFNAGRIELSMPYQLATALLLGIVLMVLVVFRLGQNVSKQKIPDSAAETPRSITSIKNLAEPVTRRPGPEKNISRGAKEARPANLKDDHYIVITQYRTIRDLRPVQEHFAANGIETVIEKGGGWFFLVTKNTYENPRRAGTDGAAALKRVVAVGARYKAPQNYESFAPKLFSDAYGKKIK